MRDAYGRHHRCQMKTAEFPPIEGWDGYTVAILSHIVYPGFSCCESGQQENRNLTSPERKADSLRTAEWRRWNAPTVLIMWPIGYWSAVMVNNYPWSLQWDIPSIGGGKTQCGPV